MHEITASVQMHVIEQGTYANLHDILEYMCDSGELSRYTNNINDQFKSVEP